MGLRGASGGAVTHDPRRAGTDIALPAPPNHSEHRLGNFPSQSRANLPPEQGSAGDDDALVARATELIARADGRPPGRRVMARELGCTEHRARVLLDALSPNGITPQDTTPVEGSGGS